MWPPTFETFVLLVILAAQVYRIIRSELLLRQERDLHKKIQEHLGTLTPAGLWPQFEALKKFHDLLWAQASDYEKQIVQYQEQLAASAKEVERLAGDVGSKAKELAPVRAAEAAALRRRSDELGERARAILKGLEELPFYTQASFREFLNAVLVKAETMGFKLSEEPDGPRMVSYEVRVGSWWYAIQENFNVRISRWPPYSAYPDGLVFGPFSRPIDSRGGIREETRAEFEERFEKEFLSGIQYIAKHSHNDADALMIMKRFERDFLERELNEDRARQR
jgi:hypothetical protein